MSCFFLERFTNETNNSNKYNTIGRFNEWFSLDFTSLVKPFIDDDLCLNVWINGKQYKK